MQHLKSLRFDLEAEHAVSRDVSSRPIEARDKAELHRVDACDENDRNSRGGGLGCKGRDKTWCDDHSHPMLEQISRQGWQSVDLIRRPAILDCHVPRHRIPTTLGPNSRPPGWPAVAHEPLAAWR